MFEKFATTAIFIAIPAFLGVAGVDIPKQDKNEAQTISEASAIENDEPPSPVCDYSKKFDFISYDKNHHWCLQKLYKEVGDKYGIDWRQLEAVHQIESGKSGNTGVESYAGAQGPMQFMPSTWRSYGIDGDGDGVADITNLQDAVQSAGNYLRACGDNIDDQLFCYNHSWIYVRDVKAVMDSVVEVDLTK